MSSSTSTSEKIFSDVITVTPVKATATKSALSGSANRSGTCSVAAALQAEYEIVKSFEMMYNSAVDTTGAQPFLCTMNDPVFQPSPNMCLDLLSSAKKP